MLQCVNPGVAEVKREGGTGAASEKPPASNSATAKKATPARKAAIEALIEQSQPPDARITIAGGQAKRLKMARRVQRISIADTGAADVLPISSREIQIVGRRDGSTTVHLWLEGDREREQAVLILLVHVQSK